ncbi:hypothetical protein ACFW1P_11310 [Paenibacillus sp. NPDC058910]|uniref:hypothetical protein n=1 Tax=unclassified Paenibacillus TaxID=185978 RepID=UPI003691FA9A
MLPKKIVEKNNWANTSTILPLVFAFTLFLVEKDNIARFVVAITLYIMFVIYLIVKSSVYLRDKESEWKWFNLIPLCVIMIVPVYLSLYNLFYFLFSVITLAILFYKIFELLGDRIEAFLYHKGSMPLTLASYYKFCVWVVGVFIFLFAFFIFVVWFISLYPSHPIALMIMESQSNFLTVTVILILSLLIAVFIIDFLIKMVFIMKPEKFKTWRRIEVQQLFIKIALIIIFADLAYSLLYLTFSGIQVERFASYNDYLLMFKNYVKIFYYAFCLHFSIPIPTISFYEELDNAVKQTPSMYIIQFFHFCINKIIDITILAYMAGIILSVLGLKKENSLAEEKMGAK